MDELPEVPWKAWAVISGIALIVGLVLLWKSTTRHEPTEDEQRWTEIMRDQHMTESVAERLAMEVRSGVTTSHGYMDDMNHVLAIRWWDAREDAREAYARQWRKYAIVPGAIAVITLLLATFAYRSQRKRAQ